MRYTISVAFFGGDLYIETQGPEKLAAHQNVAVGGDREAQGDIGWKDEREDATQAAQQ